MLCSLFQVTCSNPETVQATENQRVITIIVKAIAPKNPTIIKCKPIKNASDCLIELNQFYDIHLVTSRLPKARKATIEWLEDQNWTEFDIHFIKHGEKHMSLGLFYAAIEDHYEQGVYFVNSGTPCYLIEHPWNKDKPPLENLFFVKDWLKLKELLIDKTDS